MFASCSSLSVLTACGLQGPAPIAVLPASVNPTRLAAALVSGDELVDLGELLALVESVAAEADTSRRLAEKALRGVRSLVKEAGLLVTLPKLVNA